MGYDLLANCDVRCIQVDMVGNEKWSDLLKGNWEITARLPVTTCWFYFHIQLVVSKTKIPCYPGW